MDKRLLIVDWIGYGISFLLIVIAGILSNGYLFSLACLILMIRGLYILELNIFKGDLIYWMNVLYVICFWTLACMFITY